MPSKKVIIFLLVATAFMLAVGLSLAHSTQASGNFGVGLGQSTPTTVDSLINATWTSPEFANCTQCHPQGITVTQSVFANDTINPSTCVICHNPLYSPYNATLSPGPDGTVAMDVHANHVGTNMTELLAIYQSIGGFPADHPTAAQMAGKSCEACHGEVSCTTCHTSVASLYNVKSGPIVTSGQHVTSGANCSQCHSTLATPDLIPAHKYIITLAEGVHSILGNTRAACLVCHNPGNLTEYRLANGTVTTDVVKLCEQCHFDYYEAWINGTHHNDFTVTNSSFYSSGADSCTGSECHNPHSPFLTNFGISPTYPSGFSQLFGAKPFSIKVSTFGGAPPLFIVAISILGVAIVLTALIIILSRNYLFRKHKG